MYHVQLKAEGNDHIERALPQHQAIEVIFSFFVVSLKYEMHLSRHYVFSTSSNVFERILFRQVAFSKLAP